MDSPALQLGGLRIAPENAGEMAMEDVPFRRGIFVPAMIALDFNAAGPTIPSSCIQERRCRASNEVPDDGPSPWILGERKGVDSCP